MATTREGRELTQAQRVQQVQLAENAKLEAAVLLAQLDFENLPGTRGAWQASTLLMLRSRWRQSQTLASLYLSEYRAAETGSSFGPVIEIDFPDARYGEKLRQLTTPPPGIDPDVVAWAAQVEREVLGEVQKAALTGGRSTIDRSARANRVRYRRVTDGKPCAFCAMLASRGPVYSEETAYFRAHTHCGCTAEEVYGTWTPNAREREWVGSYVDAATAAREAGESITESTVLWRMRRNSPALFSDGITAKTA